MVHLFVIFILFERESCYVAQADLEPTILLFQSLEG
jgi:hypothetical protein